jgi:hypothetical protein
MSARFSNPFPADDGAEAVGLQTSDLLSLGEEEQKMLTWLMRQGPGTLAELSAGLGWPEADTEQTLIEAQMKGFVQRVEEDGTPRYRIRLAPKRGKASRSAFWNALDE